MPRFAWLVKGKKEDREQDKGGKRRDLTAKPSFASMQLPLAGMLEAGEKGS